jgi:hypothetical protein
MLPAYRASFGGGGPSSIFYRPSSFPLPIRVPSVAKLNNLRLFEVWRFFATRNNLASRF